MTSMANGAFRLKSRFFDQRKLQTNKHRLSQAQQVSYPTMLKYLRQPGEDNFEPIEKFSGDVLYAILIEGFGMSPSDVENLRIGDIFEVVPKHDDKNGRDGNHATE